MLKTKFAVAAVLICIGNLARANELHEQMEQMCGPAPANLETRSAVWWNLNEGEIGLLEGRVKLAEGDLKFLRSYTEGTADAQLALMNQLNELNQQILCRRSLKYRMTIKPQK